MTLRTTPYIWNQRADLSIFGGSAALALAFAALGGWIAPDDALPPWIWFAFVVGLDVGHVWTTLFRTYLDSEEVRRRSRLYLPLPIVCYLAGVALYTHSALTFWRVLTYAAVFHFVRQQVGWVAIYRARAGALERRDRLLDDAVIYAATGWPLLYWHAHAPRAFNWLIDDGFVHATGLGDLVMPLCVVYLALLVAYSVRALDRARRREPVNVGKHTVVATTAIIWFVGVVPFNSDYVFTVTNVTLHAIPYMALVWMYARERARELETGVLKRVVTIGVGAFLTIALVCAFAEELAWERLVWHDRPGWFGGADRSTQLLSRGWMMWVVPLLALPQAVHYALDGVLWRSKDAGPAQARALGFAAR